ncbi:signal transduction histidine kinase [Paenibacillus sp. JGP012]|uniref:sensor histidine kinase n=1 Tax=Paenibacillus sp. JGP012 TaxID=2735914 RepID=UPI001613443B|nr:HAMP domain-containing sensor histidine kinase [Paenibacillus sp. JGP012]MBB6022212.1 signal transduction histidine kinase [Paenibacillus sp. JGP012]
MNRFLMGKQLKLKMVLAIIISLLVAAGVSIVFQVVGETALDSYLSKSTFVENRQKDALERFQALVSSEQLSTQDHEELSGWISGERYLKLFIFVKDKLIYTSNTEADPEINEELLTQFLPSKIPITTVQFADQPAQVYLVGFYEYQYYNLLLILSVFAAVIAFIIAFLLLISHKISYIGKLEREIKILEGGNLDYKITISGRDELSSLAWSIDEMRKSFVERLGSEERVRTANRELITAISHDLRTPLTILLGYMDIIELGKYKTQEDLLQYIHNSREKAYQIKILSDKLFEYFTVSSASEEEDVDFEIYEGRELLDQLLDEQLAVIEDIDVQIQPNYGEQPFLLEMNLVAIRRVFDNIFSNIKKYADTSHPVHIELHMKQQILYMNVSNRIRPVDKTKDSNEIGLVSCKKILEQHNGTLSTSERNDRFTLQIELPVILSNTDR